MQTDQYKTVQNDQHVLINARRVCIPESVFILGKF